MSALRPILEFLPRRPSHVPPPRRAFSTTVARPADFTHAVIGGGAVGLAIARRLQANSLGQSQTSTSTILIERHAHPGTETSSRNSEVIHAGIYYGPTSLKTSLCLRGKEMLYDLLPRHGIPHKNCGKWIVAQTAAQLAQVEKVHEFAGSIGVPTQFVSREEARRREPHVRAEAGVLESPTTGILDSHAYVQFLYGAFAEAGGETAMRSEVTRVEPLGPRADGAGGWRIYTGGSEDPADAVTAETLVTSAGNMAVKLHNMIVPEGRRRKAYHAKGSYYSYSASEPRASTLVYPAPMPGHGGLGTHLTLDMGGRIRFGPDVEWVDDPDDLSVNDRGFEAALDDIMTYLPGLKRDAVHLDYAGIRPKLSNVGSVTAGQGFIDFHIKSEEGYKGWVNLMGIESPGLTSSLAIGEMVCDMLYRGGGFSSNL